MYAHPGTVTVRLYVGAHLYRAHELTPRGHHVGMIPSKQIAGYRRPQTGLLLVLVLLFLSCTQLLYPYSRHYGHV